MKVLLMIVRYRWYAIFFGFVGMAILRLPLWLSKNALFWKLMGSGKDAQPDASPDFRHWGLLVCFENQKKLDTFMQNSFVAKWFKFFATEQFLVKMEPLSSHGLWDGKKPFALPLSKLDHTGPLAVLTRATIRPSKVKAFRSDIKKASIAMRAAKGFQLAAGLGENPINKQATFSVWNSMQDMKEYAYKHMDHADVIKRTRQEEWYSEELFARFAVQEMSGTFNGKTYS